MNSLTLALAAAALFTAACAPVDDGYPAPMPPGTGPSECRAEQYSRYIGRHRSELPPRPSNEIWRVTCTTCAVTMDYISNRLNILYDQSTGVIREVRCG